MKARLLIDAIAVAAMVIHASVGSLLAQAQPTAAAGPWQPVPGQIMTRWAKDVSPEKVLPEYPRPQMVRQQWQNLNGLWDYAITKADATKTEKFDGRILVPFCIESALSGVKQRFTRDDRLWYHRSFAAPALAGGKRLLLHFGAVDWDAKVIVNGKSVAEHRGGYDAFTCDITDAVKTGTANELVVSVFDATSGMQPKGKQNVGSFRGPGGIYYTPCSGIWQTVWLETVPAAHIESLHIVPDIDNSSVTIEVNGNGGEPLIEVLDDGKVIASGRGVKAMLKIPNPKLWSPDSPFLYDVNVTSGADSVKSYFGMRKISVGKDDKDRLRVMLNNKFVFQVGFLDQGFWPDGIYTAPTDEALRSDIEITKKLGMNMARKHVKVEPDRWYYWCDKLGLLVWQDMPSGGAGIGCDRDKITGVTRDGTRVSDEANAQFEAEFKALIHGRWNHPSIVMWVVFNEAWGQYETPRLTRWVKDMDPSRLVDGVSGFHDIPAGDMIDIHRYPGPDCPRPDGQRAPVLGEFGGLGLLVPGHTWVDKPRDNRGIPDAAELAKRYCELLRKVYELKDNHGLNACVYTQTTDVEAECNGLLTYDRELKIDLATIAAANRGIFTPLPAKPAPENNKPAPANEINPKDNKVEPSKINATREAEPPQRAEPVVAPHPTQAKPLLLGNWADPSILKDGDDYYMTHSSWDFQPGLAVWHSKDLRSWRLISHAVVNQPGSIWAPDLVKHDGKFYLYYPAQPENYVVTATSPAGPWTEPQIVGVNSIDPGHVVGPDGKRYLYVAGCKSVELSPDGLRSIGQVGGGYGGWKYPKDWVTQGFFLESPKLTRHNGWYYLTCAEGGTAGPATSHMVVSARSRSPLGPWENSPLNPIIHTWDKSETWWSKGHGTLVEGPGGQWYCVLHGYMNGYQSLGRCALIEPIEWTADDWFKVPDRWPAGWDKPVRIETPLSDDFKGPQLGLQWQFVKNFDPNRFALGKGGLTLKGLAKDPGASLPLCTMGMDLAYEIETEVEMDGDGLAGLMLYYTPNVYLALTVDKDGNVRRQHKGFNRFGSNDPTPAGGRRVALRIVNNKQAVTAFYRDGSGHWQSLTPAEVDISGANHNERGAWAAVRPAVFASGTGQARFSSFTYRPL